MDDWWMWHISLMASKRSWWVRKPASDISLAYQIATETEQRLEIWIWDGMKAASDVSGIRTKNTCKTECENGTELQHRQNLLEPSSPSFSSILVSLFNFFCGNLFKVLSEPQDGQRFFFFFHAILFTFKSDSIKNFLSYLSVDFPAAPLFGFYRWH